MSRTPSDAGSSRYTDQQLILAARLYYIDRLSQAEIGKFVRVSQSKISRMLALAEHRGLVRISVPEYNSRNTAIELELKKRFGIEAIVIHSLPGVEVKPLRQIVGYFAAPAVSEWVKSRSLIVLAGGRSVQPLVEHMRPLTPVFELQVAQGMGHIDPTPGPYDAVELCRTLARSWHGSVLNINAPLLFPDKDSRQKFVQLQQIQNVLRTIEHAQIALVGVGNLEDSVLLERAIFSRADIAALRKAGAVGEILGRFYNSQGIECRTGLRDRTLSLELAKFRKIGRRVGVVVGPERAPAILAAIRGGLLNTLITDESGASALLEAEPGGAAVRSAKGTAKARH